MRKPINISTEYGNFHSELMQKVIRSQAEHNSKQILSDFEFNDHIKNYMWLVTIHVNNSSPLNIKSYNKIIDDLNKFHDEITYILQGDFKFRNKNEHPLLLIHLDAENTRFSRNIKEIDVPHFHGIVLIHPKRLNGWVDYLNNESREIRDDGNQKTYKLKSGVAGLGSISVRQFSDKFGTLDKWTSYCSKLAKSGATQSHLANYELLLSWPKDIEFYSRQFETSAQKTSSAMTSKTHGQVAVDIDEAPADQDHIAASTESLPASSVVEKALEPELSESGSSMSESTSPNSDSSILRKVWQRLCNGISAILPLFRPRSDQSIRNKTEWLTTDASASEPIAMKLQTRADHQRTAGSSACRSVKRPMRQDFSLSRVSR